MIHVVAFDFDGTLANTYPWVESVLVEVCQTFGLRVPERHEYDAFRQLDTRALLRALKIPLWQAPRILTDVRRRMQSVVSSIDLFPGIEAAVEDLFQAKITLAIVSSNAEDNVRHIIGTSMASRFAAFDCGIDLFGKAARLSRLARLFDVAPQEIMLIGDEVRDIEAARQAGTQVGVTAWGYSSVEILAQYQPDVIFTASSDIPQLLLTPEMVIYSES